MSTRYPGGLISRSKPVIVPPVNGEGGSAPGVWTLEQASYYTQQGTWPLPPQIGALWSAGLGTNGAIGDGTGISRSSPVQVGSDSNWLYVSGGNEFALSIKDNNTLWSWGKNNAGQLGQNSTFTSASPVQVGALTNWSKISCGYAFFSAIKTDGTLWACGSNGFGQLGTGNTIYRSSPVQVGSLSNWQKVACGAQHTIAIKTDGTLWAWGFNIYGALGQNNTVNRSFPVQVGALTNWQQIACGFYNTYAVKTDGTIWSWGINYYGELGQDINYSISRSSPVQIGSLTTWSYVSGGSNNGYALKNDGSLFAWGYNVTGAVGDGTGINRSSPVQIGASVKWQSVSANNSGAAVSAIKTNKTLWTWGSNIDGQLCDNSTQYRSSPVQVGSLSTWKSSAMGNANLYAIK